MKMIQMRLAIILAFLLFKFTPSKSQQSSAFIAADFDYIDSTLVFTDLTDGIGSLYLYDLKARQLTKITSPEDGYDLGPRLSKDKKNLLYISYRNRKLPSLILINLESNRADTVIKAQPFLTEVVFSKDEKSAFFFAASEFKNYSPIARPANHGYHLFKINLTTKEISQITSKEEYVMLCPRVSNDGQDIYCAMPPHGGIVKISVDNGQKSKVSFKGSPRNAVKESFIPIAIGSDSALYLAPYEIYLHYFPKKKSDFMIRSPDESQFQVVHADAPWQNLVFTTSRKGFFMYNRKTKEFRNLASEIRK